MNSRHCNKGFTLVELLVVAAITALIAVVAVISLSQSHSNTDLKSATQEIAALLREAQTRSIAQTSSTSWGVHFDNSGGTPFYALFYGPSYNSSSIAQYVKLYADICFFNPIQGSSTNVIFSQISGLPSATTSIGVQTADGCNGSAGAPVINRSSSGEIFFDNFNRSSL